MAHGMWRFGRNTEQCCIYRVPKCMREVNPQAYTPQLVLIGPFHHYLKAQAQSRAQDHAQAQAQPPVPAQDVPLAQDEAEAHAQAQARRQAQAQFLARAHAQARALAHGDITNTKSTGYLNMVTHKTIYLEAFTQRFGQATIDEFQGTITQQENMIRARYSESTDWIPLQEFVEMILQDSVFILEFLLRSCEIRRNPEKIGDPLMDEPCLQSTIRRDLILLENQLPYFILERLFELISPRLNPIPENLTLRALVISYFGLGEIIGDSTFQHFTDLFRCIRVRTLSPVQRERCINRIQHMYNADKLDSGGVKLKAVGREHSLVVNFQNGCLQIPRFSVDGNAEVTLRNIMALEQCHYPLDAYVCNYIIFLDYLIDTVKDVDLLVEKGIIRSRIGNHDVLAKIVNNLCLGVVENGSYYSGILTQVINHYVDPEKMSQNIDLELGMYPGMWLRRTNLQRCCIYRVPNSIRRVKPEAYTPQLLLIGPLHHSLKAQARKARGDITNEKSMDYLNIELRKRIYLAAFIRRVAGENNIRAEIRQLIEQEEERIRESYSESTVWIKSPEFVEMILLDSIFIIEFFLRSCARRGNPARTGDPLMDEKCLQSTIKRDLIMLENQLPYSILETLFNAFSQRLNPIPANLTFRGLIIDYFQVGEIIDDNSTFSHFTDLFRCTRVSTLSPVQRGRHADPTEHMYNAEKLYSGGVRLKKVGEEHSLVVNFNNGCLEIPRISFERHSEVKLRNIMALEQCHYPRQAYVCNYIIFMDYLIDNEKDVDLLVEKGIIRNRIGHNGTVADIVNKLCFGVVEFGSYNSAIANSVIRHYDKRRTRCCAILTNVYFNNLWRGTATVAAGIILLMTIGQFVTGVVKH